MVIETDIGQSCFFFNSWILIFKGSFVLLQNLKFSIFTTTFKVQNMKLKSNHFFGIWVKVKIVYQGYLNLVKQRNLRMIETFFSFSIKWANTYS
jgi:hypothetical protein